MKSIVRNVAFYSLALFVLTYLLPGVRVSGGLSSFIIGGIILSLMFLTIKPILNIIAFPLNLVTLGLFSFFSNVIILYLLTIFYPNISVSSFKFGGLNFAGFIVPKLYLNTFFAFIVSSLVLSVIVTFLTWITKK